MTWKPDEKPYPAGSIVRRKGSGVEGIVVGWFPPPGEASDPPDLSGPGSGVIVRFRGDPAHDERLQNDEIEFVATVQPE